MSTVKRVYLGVSPQNSPFDDQSVDRIRFEPEAVILVMKHLESGRG
ncbi:MAG: hypothetical protein ABFD97_08390 [Syntrophobacter sp.]